MALKLWITKFFNLSIVHSDWLVSIDYERLKNFVIHSFKATVYAINFSVILYFIYTKSDFLKTIASSRVSRGQMIKPEDLQGSSNRSEVLQDQVKFPSDFSAS